MRMILPWGRAQKRNTTLSGLIFRLFAMLILVTVLCCMMMLFIILQQNLLGFRESKALEAERVMGEIDDRLLDVRDALIKLSGDRSVIYTTLIPDREDASASYECISVLNATLSGLDSVRDIFLYTRGSDRVYSANYGAAELPLSTSQTMLERHSQEDVAYQQGTENWISLAQYDGRIYLICDFLYSIDHPVGILAAELTRDMFACAPEAAGEETYYELLLPEGDRFFWSASDSPADEVVAARQSNQFGYQLSYYAQEPTLLSFVMRALRVLVPLCLLLLLFDSLLAFDLAHILYAPVGKLVRTIQEKWPTAEDPEEKDAYGLITQALKNSSDREEAMTAAVQTYIPHMLESICFRLLEGGEVDEIKLRTVLAAGKYPWLSDQQGVLLVFAFLKQDYQPLDAVENEVILIAVQKEVEEDCRNGRIAVLFPKLGRLVFVGTADDPAAEDSLTVLLRRRLEQTAQKNNLHLETSSFFAWDQLQDLPGVFKEAMQQLERQIYYRQPDDDAQSTAEKEVLPDTLLQIIRAYQGHVDASQTLKAVSAVEQGLRTILARNASEQEKQETLRALRDELLTFLIARDADVTSLRLAVLPAEIGSREYDEFLSLLQTLTETLSNHKLHTAVLRMKELVWEEYADASLSLSYVADVLKMNQSYLSTLFAREQGEGFLEYLLHYRVEKAKIMLECTDTSVKEVGFKVGFSSAQNFNRVFKRYTGMTPGQYKRSREE